MWCGGGAGRSSFVLGPWPPQEATTTTTARCNAVTRRPTTSPSRAGMIDRREAACKIGLAMAWTLGISTDGRGPGRGEGGLDREAVHSTVERAPTYYTSQDKTRKTRPDRDRTAHNPFTSASASHSIFGRPVTLTLGPCKCLSTTSTLARPCCTPLPPPFVVLHPWGLVSLSHPLCPP